MISVVFKYFSCLNLEKVTRIRKLTLSKTNYIMLMPPFRARWFMCKLKCTAQLLIFLNISRYMLLGTSALTKRK